MSATVKQAAMRLLVRRDHSQHELVQKLKKRGYALADIASVLRELVEKNWQSDTRFTESYIRARSGKGYGPVRIALELNERGVTEELISNCLEAVDMDWLALAIAVKKKRFGEIAIVAYEERMKQMRFLQYRGFSTEQIKLAFSYDADL